ncbi:MAG: CHASE2 domain-containing protein [Leptolyngbya sp. SIO4C5]|nr:CHASE2 domain-containing protein [Leptolyngbya sp. SIO4C5]
MQSWLKNWQTDLLPGLSLTGLVILARLLGILQPLEWQSLDWGLRWRPAESPDPRLTLVAITETDIQTRLDYPISDQALAELIKTLQRYQPRVIGIDIFRDRPVGKGFEQLEAQLQAADNVVGINKIGNTPVAPPPMLPENRVGFADALLDDDGFLRRSFLGGADAEAVYRLSLTIRLVEQYLATEGIVLENGLRDPETMRFGRTEIPRFQPNTGGYIRADNGGNQALINFRAGPEPFAQVSYTEVMAGQVPSEQLRDRIVLVGYVAESVKDFVSSGAIASQNPSLIPGVQIQAHAVSQILSAVYENRPFLKTLPDIWEYWLILVSGLLGLALAHWQRRPAWHLLILLSASLTWLLLGYGLLVASWWLPMVPVGATFLLNAVALYPFYQAQAQLRSQLRDRQALIDSVFTSIHNGPLQILAQTLSSWPEGQPAPAAMRSDLQTLNSELRGIYETMRQEMLLPSGRLVLTGQSAFDLQIPLNELLCDVYQSTIERYRSFFTPILKIVAFKELDDQTLTSDQKRDLGRFLEEALVNLCKYAKGTTRLTVTCLQEGQDNVIRVIDNGVGLRNFAVNKSGFGTRQARKLARSLGGQFSRTEASPQGVCCELRWPIQQARWRRWWG